MKIAILGFAGQGRSSYKYWNITSNDITICDEDENITLPYGVKSQLGDNYLNNLERFDLLIRTPALHPRVIDEANPDTPTILEKVWTNTNEFMKSCPTKNIIGVTGTKGKGTTSTLITKMLEASGLNVHLGGNIGTPPLDLLANNIEPEDWVVLELANFQLIDLKISPHIATCLMIEPEHLNWHETIDEYVEAKRQIFANQQENDIAVFYAENNYSSSIAKSSKGLIIPYMVEPGAYVEETLSGETRIVIEGKVICNTNDIQLLGRHNWQNVCAAITVIWNIKQDVKAIRRAIRSFRGLPHRLEKVREVDGVTYYNDSFSAAPAATIAALDAIPGNKVVIVGGVDKNLDLSELARSILSHNDEIHRIIIIGEVGHKLGSILSTHGVKNYDILKGVTMEDIVRHAQTITENGDSVILSPGTSSFDMFMNFEDRGNQFKATVNSL